MLMSHLILTLPGEGSDYSANVQSGENEDNDETLLDQEMLEGWCHPQNKEVAHRHNEGSIFVSTCSFVQVQVEIGGGLKLSACTHFFCASFCV